MYVYHEISKIYEMSLKDFLHWFNREKWRFNLSFTRGIEHLKITIEVVLSASMVIICKY